MQLFNVEVEVIERRVATIEVEAEENCSEDEFLSSVYEALELVDDYALVEAIPDGNNKFSLVKHNMNVVNKTLA